MRDLRVRRHTMKTLKGALQFLLALVALACAGVFCAVLLAAGLARLALGKLRSGVVWLCKV